jgi:hypothetical protein
VRENGDEKRTEAAVAVKWPDKDQRRARRGLYLAARKEIGA